MKLLYHFATPRVVYRSDGRRLGAFTDVMQEKNDHSGTMTKCQRRRSQAPMTATALFLAWVNFVAWLYANK